MRRSMHIFCVTVELIELSSPEHGHSTAPLPLRREKLSAYAPQCAPIECRGGVRPFSLSVKPPGSSSDGGRVWAFKFAFGHCGTGTDTMRATIRPSSEPCLALYLSPVECTLIRTESCYPRETAETFKFGCGCISTVRRRRPCAT